MNKNQKQWFLYIIESEDGSLYTGITTDVERRFSEHSKGEGAKYFRSRKPLKVVYTEKCDNRSEALKREAMIKSYSRQKKLELIAL